VERDRQQESPRFQVGYAARGTAIGLAPFVSNFQNCEWIYRIRANPGMPRGGVLPPTPVLAPGSALGSRPRVALSSAQVARAYTEPRRPGNSRWDRLGAKWDDTMPRKPRGPTKIRDEALHAEEDGRRSEVLENLFHHHTNEKLHLDL
jgi:hypothetical protein